jgi:N-acyl-D-aspartate/D-glutamate deacylase
MKHDIILRSAIIIDGTGSPSFAGDVAIDANKIAAMGDLSAASAVTAELRRHKRSFARRSPRISIAGRAR